MNFPSFQDLFNSYVAKFREQKPEINPTVKGSWSMAFGRGISASAYSLVILAKEILKQFNPLTATGVYLELWASYDNLTRLGESPSSGTIRVFGLINTILPANSEWASQDTGLLYSNSASSQIAVQDTDDPPISIYDLSRSGSIVTASCRIAHGLQINDWVQISGATQPEYNVIAKITAVPSSLTFQYTIATTPTTPATGSPFVATPIISISEIVVLNNVATVTTYFPHGLINEQYVEFSQTGISDLDSNLKKITYVSTTEFTVETTASNQTVNIGVLRSVHANVLIQSETTGTDTVLPAQSAFDLQGSIYGAMTTAYNYEGVQGGASEESDDALRARLLISRSAQEGIFTNDQITLAALLINGNTRIFIQNPDSNQISDPDAVNPGQVRVYVIRDNDPLGPVPTGGILGYTKKSIVENGRLPAEMWDDDLFVLPPVLKSIDITMTNVRPDTASMRTAIKSQFQAYFTDDVEFGKNLDNDVLRGVAINTQDLSSGDPDKSFIESFNWTTISETIAKNELPVLGVLTVNGIIV